ncbi:MAG TPA: 2-amino-4-hydroxy-6-hydroxymethyldihydropteridine diphosphokinase [Bdellovibrionota bacterium]|nr:2-amino-4-hydroxy-6-hydroxymethyldihydropteridine diphosphokinase [Bdellovibrionota bacterium]
MDSGHVDTIFIRDLQLRCVIGVNPEERREKQDVLVNLELTLDLGKAGRSDQIADTVNYRDLKKRILSLAEHSRYQLVEALAERIAAVCLSDDRITHVNVSVEKPSALRFARTVGVKIERNSSAKQISRVFIGIASNIDPKSNIEKAVHLLTRELRITGLSAFYETEAINSPGAPAFINGVLRIETALPPNELKHSVLRVIEEKLGRVRSTDKNAPRPIDLDILIYGDLVIEMEDLRVPDPEIRERPFLAFPIFELDPDLVIPGTNEPIRKIVAYMRNLRERLRPLPQFTDRIRMPSPRPPQAREWLL